MGDPMKLYQYKLFCETSNKWEYIWKNSTEAAPTACPVDTAHTIDLNSIVIDQTIQDLHVTNVDDVQLVDVTLRKAKAGSQNTTIVTHDFTDRTNWYQNSVPLVDEALVDSGDGLTWQAASGKRNWINIHSLKLTYDVGALLMKDGSFGPSDPYEVVVKVDGAVTSETFSVDFPAGSITFSNSQAGKTVTVSYYHNDGVSGRSDYILTPSAGYKLEIEHVEIQFSKTLSFPKPVIMEVWAGGSQLSDYGDFSEPYFPYRQQKSIYRGHRDLINWCNNQYPIIPACGGLTDPILVFPFKYLIANELNPLTAGLILIRLYNLDDEPAVGEIATATFYTISSSLAV